MSITSNQLLQNKVSAGGVGQFGQGLRTFVPQFQVCPARYAYDQYGRDAPPDSINTETCPGGFPADLRISVENSLRPFVSPTYFNLPIGISGGSDTLFGRVNVNRKSAFGFQDMIQVDMNVNPLMAQGTIGSRFYGGVQPTPVYTNPVENFQYYNEFKGFGGK
jgi:hypothetical protein